MYFCYRGTNNQGDDDSTRHSRAKYDSSLFQTGKIKEYSNKE